MRPRQSVQLALAGVTVAVAASTDSYRCSELKNLRLPSSNITAVTYLPANYTIILPDAHPTCPQNAITKLPICRVEITTETSSSSSVKTELWLPDRANYPGRIVSTGNGGLNGCIDYRQLTYLSSLNFAAIGGDGGHAGMTGEPFLNHPEVIIDFSHRSIHVESELIKSVSAAYYGVRHKKSYYMACSGGGRQGFKSITDYPEDFDGVLAGAPALDFNRIIGASAIMGNAQGVPGSPGNLSPSMQDRIYADIIAQCDGLDGVVDGVIDDPDVCNYKPSSSLICSDNSTAFGKSCLTPAQLDTITTLFTPTTHPLGGELAPRLDPGATFRYVNTRFELFYSDWYKYTIYNDSTLDPTSPGFNISQAIIDADRIDPGGIRTWDPTRLSTFAKRGGKVLTYHGRADGLTLSGVSLKFFDKVEKAMGEKKMREFYRLFAVPGMGHCFGGSGAGSFGQVGYAGAGALRDDETHNAVLALVEWVENGRAPEEIVGWNERTGQTRTLCAYPKRSVLKKGGNKDEASGWVCVN